MNEEIECGNGINKQAYPALLAMLIYLALLWLPLGLRKLGLI
jgi:hypothetical protein